ncbi:SDR family NAD(P)-dependent oxidoreductase [Aquidulcibacter paucihalophilus]|uniref:SDR family NAD(P)-dependent oxidoreductase n=1 Tax=Aquidulcibacter paucihalophilus TaxID=1978549 RepID=UPI000A1955DC|nr:SDR family oxidoreductase [Aquidulcibacter paucihalophilus]
MSQPATTRRLAVITGASSGIGEAFARAYAKRDTDLCLVARRLDRLEALALELGQQHGIMAFAVQADLSKPEATDLIVGALAKQGRSCDILINNAGYSLPQTFLATKGREQIDFVAVLVTSVVSLTHALLPAMVERGYGRIINVASMVAFSSGAAGHTLYPAAKSFVVKMTQSLSAEVADKGVILTAVCPGQTESEFAKANGTDQLIAKSGLYKQTAEDVVAIAIAANEAGKEVVVPGWPNKLAVAFMKILPDSWTAALIRPQAKKFSLPDPKA